MGLNKTAENFADDIFKSIFAMKNSKITIAILSKFVSNGPIDNIRLSQMRTLLATCRRPAGSSNRLSYVLYDMNIKRNIF